VAKQTQNPAAALDQRRANHAWNAVQDVLKKCKGDKEKAKKFGGQARKLPMRIIASGLGQALAFLKAKDYAPDLLIALGDWVLDKRSAPDSKAAPPRDDTLLLAVIQGHSDFLRRATDEVLAYLLWLNRFAEAEKITEGE
jgi:CRISPR-associated protein Cmr5